MIKIGLEFPIERIVRLKREMKIFCGFMPYDSRLLFYHAVRKLSVYRFRIRHKALANGYAQQIAGHRAMSSCFYEMNGDTCETS